MDQVEVTKGGIKSFPRNFWNVITMEFFERGSYYGVMSVFSVYLVLSHADGGLGFTKNQVGIIKSVITPLLYILPILSGALGDRLGYKKLLAMAFVVMSCGYYLAGQADTYPLVFGAMLLVVLGAGFFKPLISGTIARVTNEHNSTFAFGIFYWTINLGAFVFPLFMVPVLKNISYSYIFNVAAVATGLMLLVVLFLYKDPITIDKRAAKKPFSDLFVQMFSVLKDVRFIMLIAIYSCFWILYFQMFDTVLWYVNDYVDATPLNDKINTFLSLFVESPNWRFDVEHVTVINAGTIIVLQILVSSIVRHFKALPTMIVGIGIATSGMFLLSLSTDIWVFFFGIVLFTVGEMTAHPKFLSYVGQIAPADKKATYLGYSFLYGVIGSGVGGVLGASLYTYYVDQLSRPDVLWYIFTAIGVSTMVGLLAFHHFASKGKHE